MADNADESRFDSRRAELFEVLGHPVRIKILESLRDGPLGFSDLKRAAGLESSGNLQFHLGKLGDLVRTTSDGNYCLTDEGKEALRVVEATERVTSAKGTDRLATRLKAARIKVFILLALLMLGGVAVIAEGSLLGSETQIIPLGGGYQMNGLVLQPGEQHFLFGLGNPGWSGTIEVVGVVLTSNWPFDRVSLEFDGEGSFNGTWRTYAIVPVDQYVDVNVQFPQGLALTNCSVTNLSPGSVAVLGIYVQLKQVTHPNQGLGEDLRYLGGAIVLVDAALLVSLWIRGRRWA